MKAELRLALQFKLAEALSRGSLQREADIKMALTAGEWREYQQARRLTDPLLHSTNSRALFRYRFLLREGDAATKRARVLKPFGNYAFERSALLRAAAGSYERALSLIRNHASLWVVCDRPEAEWGVEEESMPRPCGSRSKFKVETTCAHCDDRLRAQRWAIANAIEAAGKKCR